MKLDVGKHEVTVTGAYLTESQTKGTPGIVFQFENEDGEIDCTRWITENTADRVSKDLQTLGFDPSVLGGDDWLAQLESVGEKIKGNRVQIVCEEEVYQGVPEVKVKWINDSRGGGSGGSLGLATKKRLAALLSGKPAGLVSGPRSTAPTLDPEDVPF